MLSRRALERRESPPTPTFRQLDRDRNTDSDLPPSSEEDYEDEDVDIEKLGSLKEVEDRLEKAMLGMSPSKYLHFVCSVFEHKYRGSWKAVGYHFVETHEKVLGELYGAAVNLGTDGPNNEMANAITDRAELVWCALNRIVAFSKEDPEAFANAFLDGELEFPDGTFWSS